MTTYYVSLVAVSGREQPVLLRVRREGICLYSLDDRVSARCHLQVSKQLHGPPTTAAVSGMQELQRLPFPHIVKWIPSNLRSREPGDNECLDIQIETVSGRKDLRMRCHSQEAVQNIMADIRGTVNVSLAHPAADAAVLKAQQTAAEGAEVVAMCAVAAAADPPPGSLSALPVAALLDTESPPTAHFTLLQQWQLQQQHQPPALSGSMLAAVGVTCCNSAACLLLTLFDRASSCHVFVDLIASHNILTNSPPIPTER
jgi:hypothetical protein